MTRSAEVPTESPVPPPPTGGPSGTGTPDTTDLPPSGPAVTPSATGPVPTGPAATTSGSGGRGRRIAAVVLVVLGCVLAPLAVTVNWARAMVTDQDTYLSAVAPLATDPVVLNALRDRAVDQLDQAITAADPQALVTAGLAELGAPERLSALGGLLAPVLQNQLLDAASGMVDRALHSEAFLRGWTAANASAHSALVGLLDGSADPALARTQAVAVRVDSVLDTVRDRLTAAGATWADRIPSVPTALPLVDPTLLDRAQGWYSALDVLGIALPVVALLLLAAGVAVSRSRWTTTLAAAAGVFAALALLRLALQWGYGAAADASPAAPAVARVFAEQVTTGLRSGVLLVAVVAGIVAVVAALAGPLRSARLARQGQQA